MNDFFLKLLLAALISLCGWFATYYWEKYGAKKPSAQTTSEPIAHIVSKTNEVMRRPAKHLIWKSANKNEGLYDGEAVRTTSRSEAQIEFIEQQVTVSLEPDSVIEISRENGKLNLSFLEGNLIVKAAQNSDVTLRSGDRQISLGGGTANAGAGGSAASELVVSKSATSANLEVQSAKGTIKELGRDASSSKALEAARFRILHPTVDEIFYVTPKSENGETPMIGIDFTPLDASYEITVEVGEDRDDLSPLANLKVDGKSGRIAIPAKLGKSYVRLSASIPNQPQSKLRTPIARALVRAKIAPELIFPADKAVFTPSGPKQEVKFQWSNPGKLNHLRIEVSTTPDMKNSVESRERGAELHHLAALGNERKPLFWRVLGRLPNTNEALSSPIYSFRLNTEKSAEKPLSLVAPRLQQPADGSSMELAVMRDTGLRFAWTTVPGASEYEISLREVAPPDASADAQPRTYKFTNKTPSGHVEKLKPGRYTWSVVAKDDLGQVSPSSESRVFAVAGIPTLNWADKRTSESVLFKGLKPTLRASWERGPGRPASWRLRMAMERMPATAEKESWIPAKDPMLEKPLESGGTYQLEAEALDEKGEVLARTPIRTVVYEQAPPPPPPKFAQNMPQELKASEKGAIEIAWLPVTDAKKYQVLIRSKDGIFTKSWQSKGTKHAFERLPPGEFDVVLQSIDELERTGGEEIRPLHVPQYSDVRAPKFKTLNVK